MTVGNISNKRTRWNEDIVTEVIEIPIWDEDMKEALFYNKMDYHEFQEAEQRRYDRMMTKHIQRLVYEKMAPEIQAATDRGATPEEIEAMMPQTTEAIFALIGGIPDMPAQLKAKNTETIHRKSDDGNIAMGDSVPFTTRGKSTETREANVRADDGASEVTGEKLLPTESVETKEKNTESFAAQSLIPNKEKDGHPPDAFEEEIYSLFGVDAPKDSTSPRSQPVEDTTDDDIYALFGVDDSSAKDRAGTVDIGAAGNDSTNQGSDSSLTMNPETLQAQKPTSKSVDDSIASLQEIQDEINEVLGTSISKEIHLEDLIPDPLQEMAADTDGAESDEQIESTKTFDHYNPEDMKNFDEMTLQEKFKIMLPEGLHSGPRHTRDSILFSKVKHTDGQ